MQGGFSAFDKNAEESELARARQEPAREAITERDFDRVFHAHRDDNGRGGDHGSGVAGNDFDHGVSGHEGSGSERPHAPTLPGRGAAAPDTDALLYDAAGAEVYRQTTGNVAHAPVATPGRAAGTQEDRSTKRRKVRKRKGRRRKQKRPPPSAGAEVADDAGDVAPNASPTALPARASASSAAPPDSRPVMLASLQEVSKLFGVVREELTGAGITATEFYDGEMMEDVLTRCASRPARLLGSTPAQYSPHDHVV